jgi:hypothetical protein
MPTIDGYANGEPIEAVDINQYFLRGNRNAIINGDFRVAQRGTTLTVADGAYGLDRWVALGSGTGGVGSSGQNVGMTQVAASGADGVNSLNLESTFAGLKFGCVQIIESRNLGGLKSGTVTVSFKAAVTNGAADVRCAVLGWSGFADAVTRDVVSTSGTPWLSSPPTLAADWSYLNTPVDLNVTNTVATYSVNANVTGLPNNLAVFIWVNGTSHASDGTLLLNDVQLESGAIATPFERKTFQEQFADCQRYYEKSYDLNTVPATVGASNWVMYATGSVAAGTTGIVDCFSFFQVRKRTAPSVVVFDFSGNANRCRRTQIGVANNENQDVRDVTPATLGFYFRSASSAFANTISGHYTAEAEL